MVQAEAVLRRVVLEEPVLDDPVDLGVDERELVGLDGGEGPVPQVEGRLVRGVVGALPLDERRRLVRYSRWMSRALIVSRWRGGRAPPRHVVADLADRPDRVLDGQVPHRHPRLDHPQDEVGGADLEHRRRLAHVRVADDDVQPPVVLGVGMRFVPGVDDGSAAGRRRGHALPDVVGPLAHGIRRALGRHDELAGAGGELPADEERQEDVGEGLELARAARRGSSRDSRRSCRPSRCCS